MHPTNDTTHDPADVQIDEELRRHLLVASDDAEERDYSRRVAAHRLDDAIATEARRRSPRIRPARRRSAVAMVGGVAAALLVAGALVPGLGGDGDSVIANGPFVAADASAAEVLEQAAARMLASGNTVGGSGTTWHSSSTGSDGTVWEAWYDGDRQVARWAMYTPGVVPIGLPGAIEGTDTYYVLDSSVDGASGIRQYVREDEGDWTPQPGGSQMESSGATDVLGGSTVETEAIAWLRSVGAASSAGQVRDANERFVERTHMWFAPPMASTDPDDVRAAARAMQALYLMRIAQLEPAAVAQLYRDVADLESLARLDDGEVDGRDVIRVLLFAPPNEFGGDTLQAVLLLDERTGAPVGMESEDGKHRTVFVPAKRASDLDDDPVSCGGKDLPPCELLRGEGPVAAAADRIAKRMAAPVDPTPSPEGGEHEVGNAPAAP